MKEQLKKMIKENMENNIRYAYQNSSMKDTPFAGMVIVSAIGESAKAYKESLSKEKSKFGLSENEIAEIVDSVAKELHDQYID